MGEGFVDEHRPNDPDLLRANDRMRHDFGIDVLGDDVCLPVLFPSRDLSIVTAIEEQSPPAAAETARLTRIETSLGRALAWTGPWLGGTHWGGGLRGFPLDRLRRARAAGRRVVLFSLGTNIAAFRRRTPMGGASSGAAFIQTAIDVLRRAFGDDPEVELVVATGGWRDDPVRTWPARTVAAAVVPQRQLLAAGVDAFITHHGYNSTVEGILAEAPMVAFPGYGDQIANAEFCVRRGVSVARWDLRRVASTCRPESLRDAVIEASGAGPAAALRSLRHDLVAAGGAGLGADLVLGLTA